MTESTQPPRTIYDATSSEIFWKNFLAGVGRGLGSIVIYFIFVLIMATLAIRFVWPMVEPYVMLYQNSMESLQNFQNMMPGAGGSGKPGASPLPGSGWSFELFPDAGNE